MPRFLCLVLSTLSFVMLTALTACGGGEPDDAPAPKIIEIDSAIPTHKAVRLEFGGTAGFKDMNPKQLATMEVRWHSNAANSLSDPAPSGQVRQDARGQWYAEIDLGPNPGFGIFGLHEVEDPEYGAWPYGGMLPAKYMLVEQWVTPAWMVARLVASMETWDVTVTF